MGDTVDDSDSSDTEYFVGTINQKDISENWLIQNYRC